MTTIPITILLEDIKTTSFGDFSNCAITRAVRRAGVIAFHAGFNDIVNPKGELIAELESEISSRVIGMYNYLHSDCNFIPDDIKELTDIHTFITLTEEAD